MENILITNHFIADYTGSEMYSYELANELSQMGYNVEIATLKYDYPLKALFLDSPVKVTDILHESLDRKKYDLIWAHHSPVLYYCLFNEQVSASKIIFSSLSPFLDLEGPPILVNNLNFCLANSDETRDRLLTDGVSSEKLLVFYNFAPECYFDAFQNERENCLQKICIVSNHLPDEVKEAIQILNKMNIKIEIIGGQGRSIAVSPEALSEYDAIITIGKTVQYGLAMGIPVFCYDIHGGPGWITTKNVREAIKWNFSGRGFNNRFDAQSLVNQLLIGYEEVINQRLDLHQYAKEHLNLRKNTNKLFVMLEDQEDVNIDQIVNKFKFIRRHNDYYLDLYAYRLCKDYEVYLLNQEILENKQELAQQLQEKEEIICRLIEDNYSLNENINNMKNEIDNLAKEHQKKRLGKSCKLFHK